MTAAYDQKASDTSDHLLGKFHDQVPQILAFHVLAVISAALMVVFAAGLFRRLRATAGPDSLVPGVAAIGVLATAVVLFIGAGLDTEFVFAFTDDEVYLDPSAATVYGHWIGTIPWCWACSGCPASRCSWPPAPATSPGGSASSVSSAAGSRCCSAPGRRQGLPEQVTPGDP